MTYWQFRSCPRDHLRRILTRTLPIGNRLTAPPNRKEAVKDSTMFWFLSSVVWITGVFRMIFLGASVLPPSLDVIEGLSCAIGLLGRYGLAATLEHHWLQDSVHYPFPFSAFAPFFLNLSAVIEIGPPSMKRKKVERFRDKMSLTGC